MRIGSEKIGRNGGVVLAIAAVGSVGLAIHGYGRGISPAGSSLSVSAANTAPSVAKSTTTTTSGSTSVSSLQISTTSTTAPKLGPLLSSTQYASVSYRIYPGPESSQAKTATAGFNISVKLSGSNEIVSVSVPGSSSAPQTSTFPKGDSVYFVETSLGDDSGTSDYNAGDDGIIVTNSQGRIVE
ncbi:MAG: hypothetical protein HKL84_01170 [Acidimicrobiaceae bacterium]|nr:hypothetical protein [Acidimicrobiaceae bacterium]